MGKHRSIGDSTGTRDRFGNRQLGEQLIPRVSGPVNLDLTPAEQRAQNRDDERAYAAHDKAGARAAGKALGDRVERSR